MFLGVWQEFDYWWVFAIGGLGGLLGVLFSVPLRRSLIVEQNMSFPEGQAAAEVLRAGDNPAQGVKILGGAAAARRSREDHGRERPAPHPGYGRSGRAYCGQGHRLRRHEPVARAARRGLHRRRERRRRDARGRHHRLEHRDPDLLRVFPRRQSRARAGGRRRHAAQRDAAGAIRGAQIRYLGVGAMLIGGVWTLWTIRGSILSGIRSGLAATRANVGATVLPTERDLPMKYVLGGIVVFTLPLAALYYAIVGNLGVAVAMTIIMILAGFVFCSVARVSRRPRRLVEQPDLRHHHLHDPVRRARFSR